MASAASIPILDSIAALRQFRATVAGPVGFVPTMGALHEGHLALVDLAGRENSTVVVSVFVNPAQFGQHEDLSRYPRTREADLAQLASVSAHLTASTGSSSTTPPVVVFAPSTADIYPSGPPSQVVDGPGSFVTVTPLGNILEGTSRPVFFRGVATVCAALFNIVRPDRVYFGQKDYQQTRIIDRLLVDLHFGAQLRIGPTVRNPPVHVGAGLALGSPTLGLALSSRNVYLGPFRRQLAEWVPRSLEAALRRFESGLQDGVKLRDAVVGALIDGRIHGKGRLAEPVLHIHYVSVADPDSLVEVDGPIDMSRGAAVLVAVTVSPIADHDGSTDTIPADAHPVRLLDNILLGKARDRLAVGSGAAQK